MEHDEREQAVAAVAPTVGLPPGVRLRVWHETDFPEVQRLTGAEGWPTMVQRPADGLAAWRGSWPALTAVDEAGAMAGFLRALTDGAVTTYVADIMVAPAWRGRGLGTALLAACQQLHPSTRLDLLAVPEAVGFYESTSFRHFAGFRRAAEARSG